MLSVAARRWGEEIGCDQDRLVWAILIAYADGEFDEALGTESIIGYDDEKLTFFSVSKDSPLWLADVNQPRLRLIELVRTGHIHVHPEALGLFAKRRGLPAPSFIAPVEPSPPPVPRPNHSEPEVAPKKQGGPQRRDVISALWKLYPSGPPAPNRKIIREAVIREIGREVSDKTIDRAREELWPSK